MLKDEISGENFLVDTGALVSVFSASPPDRSFPSNSTVSLIAANGSRINTYGSRTIPVSFNGHRYSWRFIVADVNRSLLGADFLSANNLLVDTSNRRLLDSQTFQVLSVQTVPTDVSEAISCVSSPNSLKNFRQYSSQNLRKTSERPRNMVYPITSKVDQLIKSSAASRPRNLK
jgi:hypothetical protein